MRQTVRHNHVGTLCRTRHRCRKWHSRRQESCYKGTGIVAASQIAYGTCKAASYTLRGSHERVSQRSHGHMAVEGFRGEVSDLPITLGGAQSAFGKAQDASGPELAYLLIDRPILVYSASS